MKFLDRLILGIFAVIMLLMAIFSGFIIFGWIDIATMSVVFTNALANTTVCNILIGVDVVIILLALKAIFFEGREKSDEYEEKDGILLQNDDGKLLITKETLKNMVNAAVSKFASIKSAQTKIILDSNNDLSISLTIEVTDNAVIKELSNNVQVKVKETMKESMGIDVKNMDIKVVNIVSSQKTQEEK